MLFLHETHQMGMFECYPDREGHPGFLYEERILPMREVGRTFIGTFVSTDIPLTRRFISQMYAFGKWVIVPWDVFDTGGRPRIFSTPADYADLYGFVRANAEKLDNYYEAAIAGEDFDETRYDDTPPVLLQGGSQMVRAVVRAQPGKPNAPVVIHLIEWADHPEPFTLVINLQRFFGNRPVRVTLSTPPAYDAMTHRAAQQSGDYSKLTVEKILAQGNMASIEIPEIYPWGLLTVDPITKKQASGR